jgi:hypothetical protein
MGSVTYTGAMKPLKLTPAVGGWLHADWGDGKAWVRFGKDKRDRLNRIVELHTSDPANVRRIPLKRIHAAATMRGAGLVQLMLALGFNEQPPPDMFSRPVDKDVGQTLERRFRLKRPPGKRLADEFYRDVAHAYQSAVAFGMNPRQAIVADTGAADATVAGWVLDARKRGYLPKGQPGKVTARPLSAKVSA